MLERFGEMGAEVLEEGGVVDGFLVVVFVK